MLPGQLGPITPTMPLRGSVKDRSSGAVQWEHFAIAANLVTYTRHCRDELLNDNPSLSLNGFHSDASYDFLTRSEEHKPEQVDNIPTMIDLPVTDSLAGRLVKDLTLPDGVLISTQIFQDQSEVVHGDTRLKAGATLYLVVNESNISQVRKLFL